MQMSIYRHLLPPPPSSTYVNLTISVNRGSVDRVFMTANALDRSTFPFPLALT